MRKLILMISFIMCFCSTTMAQFNIQPTSFQSPEVASLINEVITPVSHSSGTVNLSIPLYTVKQGDISVPIALNYDASGVKVNSLPSWVGQNWNLKAGGCVTRIVKGLSDEYKESWNGLEFPDGYFFNKNHLNTQNWETNDRIKTLANTFVNGIIDYDPKKHVGDLEPDEFIFNFCGHQGKFYRDLDDKWIVDGQSGYRIEHAIINNYAQGWYSYNDYTFYDILLGNIRVSTSPIGGFKITVPDGTIFYFGLFERIQQGWPSAPVNPTTQPDLGWESVEITADFFEEVYKENINTWQLVKIISPTGNEVRFIYERGPERVSFSEINFYNSVDGKVRGLAGGKYGYGSSGVSHRGMVILPSYLSKIQTDNEIISFKRSIVENLKYEYPKITSAILLSGYSIKDIRFFTYKVDWYEPIKGVYDPQLYGGTNSPYLGYKVNGAVINAPKFKDCKLDIISCTAKTNLIPHTEFTFDYNAGVNKRLQLKLLKKNNDPPYQFFYNSTKLPDDYLNEKVDHWGYYNNVSYTINFNDPKTFGDGYYNSRNPNFDYAKAESLEEIQFPTGGRRKFIFEPQRYSYVINRDETTGNLSIKYEGSNIMGGGLRIKEIIDDDGDKIVRKQYTYEDGMLNGRPVYYWPNYSGKTLYHNATYTAVRFFSSSIVPVSSNPAGGVISYSQVTEKTQGNGNIIYSYSNHNTYPDQNSVTTDLKKSIYSPLSSRENLRGKLLEAVFYEEGNNSPVKRETHTYQIPNDDAKYLKSVYIKRLQVLANEIDVTEASAYRIYVHPYNVIKKTEYLTCGNLSSDIITTNEWTYDSYNQVSTESRATSGQTEKTMYYYPYNYMSGTNIYKSMVDNNMISPVIEKVNYYNNIETARYRLEYDKSTVTYDKILPTVSKSRFDVNGNWEINETITQYDKKGNPVEITYKDGRTTAYIWGYGGLYIVAEIQNATFNTVKNRHSSLYSLLDQPLSAELSLKAESALRSLTEAKITTYVYSPFVGCIKVTDPSGRSTSYEYDGSGRLAAVRDANGSLLQKYEYHFTK